MQNRVAMHSFIFLAILFQSPWELVGMWHIRQGTLKEGRDPGSMEYSTHFRSTTKLLHNSIEETAAPFSTTQRFAIFRCMRSASKNPKEFIPDSTHRGGSYIFGPNGRLFYPRTTKIRKNEILYTHKNLND